MCIELIDTNPFDLVTTLIFVSLVSTPAKYKEGLPNQSRKSLCDYVSVGLRPTFHLCDQ